MDNEQLLLSLNYLILDKIEKAEYINLITREEDTIVITYKSGKQLIVDIPKGEQGEAGQSIEGTPGADGKDGSPGKDGVDGKNGIDGVNGRDGSNGKDGVNGRDGTDGENGIDGSNGKDGKKGTNGKNGSDGLDGNGITNITINNIDHLIIATRDKTYDLGLIKRGGGGGGGSGTEFTYTNSLPMPVAVGGFPAGTVFDNMSLKDLWTGLLYSYGYPAFTSFMIDIDGPREVGDTIPAGTYEADWAISNTMMLEPMSIIITYVNDNLVLADHIDNLGTYFVDLPDITYDVPTVITFKIEAKNTLGDTFMTNYSVNVLDRVYVGESALTMLDDTSVKALRFNALQENINDTYNMQPGGYKWFCYPTSMGTRVNFEDFDTGFDVPMNDPQVVNILNIFGLQQPYYCYRTYYELNGSIKVTIR